MKLSKDDLSFALGCAKQYFYDSLNSDYPGKDDQENGELFRKLEQEADNDTLEIEGYERADLDDAEEMGWTRYIPDEPRTHPESCEFVLTCMKGDMEVVEFKAGAGFYFYNEGSGRYFVDDPYFPLFWRRLPKPPKELKESPRWRPLPPPPIETGDSNETY